MLQVLLYYNDSLLGRSIYMKEISVHWLSMVYMLAYISLILLATCIIIYTNVF